MSDQVTRWAFTFGQGYNLANNYMVVEADYEDEARAIFVKARRGRGVGVLAADAHHRWAFMYPMDDRFDEQVERFGLSEVPLDTPIDFRNGQIETPIDA